MPDQGLMLSQILGVRDEKHKAGEKTPQDFERFKARVAEEMKKIRWTAAMPKLVEKLGELLEIPLPGVMISAWDKSDEIKKTLDDSRKSPEDEFSVELAEHTFTTELHPEIEIQVSKLPAKVLKFVVEFSLELKGIELKIRKGEVLEIKTGSCKAGGKLSYDNLVLAEREFTSFELPRIINRLELQSSLSASR
jgi:hypothetical protein